MMKKAFLTLALFSAAPAAFATMAAVQVPNLVIESPRLNAQVATTPAKVEPTLNAINEYFSKDSGVFVENGKIKYPFGHIEPVIVCAPLRICTLELQAGETVQNVAFGDTVRWSVTPAKSGDKTIVIIKALVSENEPEVTTNGVITTDRRVYTVTLKSDPINYMPLAAFYYPQEIVQTWNNVIPVEKAPTSQSQESVLQEVQEANTIKVDPTAVNYDWQMRGDSELLPVRVFDDSKRLFIQMPEGTTQAPAVVVDGEVVNYRLVNNYYIVDRIGQRTTLFIGIDDKQRKVEIQRKQRGFFSAN